MNTTTETNNKKPSLTIEIPPALATTAAVPDNTNAASISLQQQATIDQLAHRKRWIDTNIDNGCLTASAFGHALGLKGRIYDYVDYLRQKVGTKEEFRGNSATFHGQRTENTSKMVYEVLCCGGKVVDEGGFYPAITKETGAGHLACSPDGIVSWQDDDEEECDDNNNKNNNNSEDSPSTPIPNFPSDFTKSNRRRPKRLLEIKSPIAAIYNGGRSDQTPHGIPKAYMCQIQGQIYMTGAEDCDFFVYVAKHPQCLALWRVKPCQTFWDWMLPKLLKICEFIAVKPKSTPTHEILPRDFKFDDFPDWGCIPVEGIYCPTKLITGSPLKDVQTFPYFFDELQIDSSTIVRLRRGKVPDLESQVFHPMMRILAVRGVREGDWVLWRKIKNNTTTNHEKNANNHCFCCGSQPPLLGNIRKNGSVISETVHEDAAPATPQKTNSHYQAEEHAEEMFILRVLTLRPDLNQIEAEIHYKNDNENEQRESMLNLTPSSKISHQHSDISSQNTNQSTTIHHQCSICCERTKLNTTDDANNNANTKIIMVEPSVFNDISVIRRKARPVRDEIRYWQEAKQEAKEREKAENNQVDSDNDASSRKQQHQEKEKSSSAPSTRKFFTSNSVHLIAQLWNDPIQVLLPSPTCKTFECLEASLSKLRKTIGGNMLKVSPRCAACLWHIVTVFEQEKNQKELENLLATQQQEEQNQQSSSNNSRSTSPLLPNFNSSSSPLAGSVNSSAPSSQQFFHINNNNNGRKNINLMNVKSTKELKERIRQARQKMESPRLWVQDSFQLSTICHKVLLGAIRASGSVSQHVLVNQTCAVMTEKVFNHLLDENRFTGHHRRRASPLLPPPNVRTEFNSWIERSSQLMTTKDQQQQQQHQKSDSQKLRRFEDFSASSSQQSPSVSQSFFPPVASKSTSTSPLFNNNNNNNNTAAFNSSPATTATASSMINLSGQNVWETPIWIVCSDHEGEETRMLAERIASVRGSSSSNVVDDDIGEFPDIYRLVEACADRGLDECPWVWFVARK